MSAFRILKGRRPPRLLCCVFAVISLMATGCGPGANNPDFVRTIPGTERAAAAAGSMYVSPDERWMTYFTCNPNPYLIDGLVSVELPTCRHVEHHLSEINEGERVGLERKLFLGAFSNHGRGVGWFDRRLYILLRTGDYLIVDNNESGSSIGKLPRQVPRDSLMLSDGPEWGAWRRELASRLGDRSRYLDQDVVEDYSAAWQGGRYAETTYWWDRDANRIVAGRPGNKVERVKNLSGGSLLTEAYFSSLRTSPNESYLAYLVGHRLRYMLSPFARDDVHVIDLASGRDRVVCRFRIAGNLQWSPDGKRLYLTGNNSDDSRGVYVVDVEKAFE